MVEHQGIEEAMLCYANKQYQGSNLLFLLFLLLFLLSVSGIGSSGYYDLGNIGYNMIDMIRLLKTWGAKKEWFERKGREKDTHLCQLYLSKRKRTFGMESFSSTSI